MTRSARAARSKRRAMLLTTSLAAIGAPIATAANAERTWKASAAASVEVKDEGRLQLLKSSGSQLIDEGPASGTIPGKARIVFVYDGDPTVSAQITIYGRQGIVSAHGTARLSSPTNSRPSFAGTLTITGGSGRYSHARGGGRLYGVFYRRSYAITVQTEGTLRY